jgi:hypothetical protein
MEGRDQEAPIAQPRYRLRENRQRMQGNFLSPSPSIQGVKDRLRWGHARRKKGCGVSERRES